MDEDNIPIEEPKPEDSPVSPSGILDDYGEVDPMEL